MFSGSSYFKVVFKKTLLPSFIRHRKPYRLENASLLKAFSKRCGFINYSWSSPCTRKESSDRKICGYKWKRENGALVWVENTLKSKLFGNDDARCWLFFQCLCLHQTLIQYVPFSNISVAEWRGLQRLKKNKFLQLVPTCWRPICDQWKLNAFWTQVLKIILVEVRQ